MRKLKAIKEWLAKNLIERDEEIEAFVTALLAREHVFLIGPPGTGKSLLAEALCHCVKGAQFFGYLMNKFTAPEDLFGQVSIKKMDEEDVYERKTEAMLPEADIAFLDEIWKANSAINNALLKIINERIYRNGTNDIKVPLTSMFCASNEFPEGDELGAIYDRIAFKFIVSYVSADNFKRLTQMQDLDITSGPKITLKELGKAQRDAMSLTVPDNVWDALCALRAKLAAQNVTVSDRKWRQSVKLLKAKAYLESQTHVSVRNITVLKDVLWMTEQQVPVVQSTVLDIADPVAKVALEFSNEFKSVMDNASFGTQDECAEAVSKVKSIKQKVKLAYADNQSESLETLLERIDKALNDLVEKLVGAA